MQHAAALVNLSRSSDCCRSCPLSDCCVAFLPFHNRCVNTPILFCGHFGCCDRMLFILITSPSLGCHFLNTHQPVINESCRSIIRFKEDNRKNIIFTSITACNLLIQWASLDNNLPLLLKSA